MTKTDLKRIEDQADVSFEKGQIIGNKARRAAKKTFLLIFIGIASVIATIVFFIYGFLDHKPRKLL